MKIWNPGTVLINKYLALKTIIESNGWYVKLFAMIVGARGYSSKSVLCCFKKLGFSNTLIKNTTKKLSKSSMECPFWIWLSIIRGVPFDFNTQQQDVVEILQVVLDELKGISKAASHLICNTQKITVSCYTAFVHLYQTKIFIS